MVISLLHHFLLKYSGGVSEMTLNADNCVGQNKNNSVLQYLMWRVATRMNSSVELTFMVAGHTKLSPDYGFGIFKRVYRNADVNSIEDVCNLMNRSNLLIAEPVGTERGDVLIPCYDWQSKFESLGKVSGIKQLHHFAFDAYTQRRTWTSKLPGNSFVHMSHWFWFLETERVMVQKYWDF